MVLGNECAGGLVNAMFCSSQVMCSERLFRVMKPAIGFQVVGGPQFRATFEDSGVLMPW